MNTFLLYLVLKADAIQGLLGCGGILLALFGGIAYIALICEEDKVCEPLLVWAVIGCISFFTAVLMPNTQQLAVLYTVPKVTHAISSNKKIQAIPDKLLTLANKKLDNAIEGK